MIQNLSNLSTLRTQVFDLSVSLFPFSTLNTSFLGLVPPLSLRWWQDSLQPFLCFFWAADAHLSPGV